MKNWKWAVVLGVLLFACKGKPGESPASEVPETGSGESGMHPSTSIGVTYDPATEDDSLAVNIAEKLQAMFNKELEIMTPDDRSFQLYKVNLDTDPGEEVFIRFMSPYFCGTGGCNFLLLDEDLDLVTRFTVLNPPLFIEPVLKNNWKVILVKSEGEWKELAFQGDGYPTNPSVVAKAPYDAPSGNAMVIFSNEEPYLPAKGYGF